MDERILTDSDGGAILFLPPKHPEFETIEIGEIERRIGAALSLPEDLCQLLADAVMTWTPPPSELGDYVARAISALDSMFEFFLNVMPDERSFWNWRKLKNDTESVVRALHMLRDRVHRTCTHDEMEDAPEATAKLESIYRAARAVGMSVGSAPAQSRRCKSCGMTWAASVGKPQRTMVLRAFLPIAAGRQRPGRAAFLFFVTDLIRDRMPAKIDAMRIGAKLIAMFWSDVEPYQDHQLEGAYREGKEASRSSRLMSSSDFAEMPMRRQLLEDHLIWIRIRKEQAAEVGST